MSEINYIAALQKIASGDEQLTREDCRHIALDALSTQPSALQGAWRPMEEWADYPSKDELVFLLVDYRDGGDHPLDDWAVGITIGANSDHNVGDGEGDGWRFAGWCWSHDHFTEGKGNPIAWKPLPDDLIERPRTIELGRSDK